MLEPGAQHAAEELVETLAVPPSVHVGLAQAQRALCQNAPEQALVVHLDVPRVRAADPDVGEWTEITIPSEDGNVLLMNDWVGPIAVSPDGDTIFAGSYSNNGSSWDYRLYRSDDYGYT